MKSPPSGNCTSAIVIEPAKAGFHRKRSKQCSGVDRPESRSPAPSAIALRPNQLPSSTTAPSSAYIDDVSQYR